MDVTFHGAAGKLEGYLTIPSSGMSNSGVVVCHPHPLMGGNMHNNVVIGICYALERLGIASLRFNFRGVGKSDGIYDDGEGETEDASEALKFLTSNEEIDQQKIGITGYSFGAGIAMKVARRNDIAKALSVVAHARLDPENDLSMRSYLPIQFVVGNQDKLMSQDQIKELKDKLTIPVEMCVIPNADHFFQGRESEAGELVANFFRRWIGNV